MSNLAVNNTVLISGMAFYNTVRFARYNLFKDLSRGQVHFLVLSSILPRSGFVGADFNAYGVATPNARRFMRDLCRLEYFTRITRSKCIISESGLAGLDRFNAEYGRQCSSFRWR